MALGYEKLQEFIHSNIGETRDYGASFFTLIGLSAILFAFGWIFGHPQDMYIYSGLLLLGGFALIEGNHWLIRKRNQLLEKVSSFNKYLQGSKDRLDNIDIIHKKTELIYDIFSYLIKMRRFFWLFYSRRIIAEQNEILNNEIMLLIGFLDDLKKDLEKRICEYTDRVKGTKKSLSALSSTPELESISELQKARLDRQIEQFEELQRVLVKV